MRTGRICGIAAALAVMWTVAAVSAQAPAPGRGAGAPAGRGGAAPSSQVIPSSPPVDAAAYDRGRAIWSRECIDCHGSTARGSETGPNIVRTKTVNFDRASFTPGSVLAPFLAAGHPTQSGKQSATFTSDDVLGLAHFLRQKVNDTMRGSPLFTVGDIVVGNVKAGETFFNGAGKCNACHTATSKSLAGIATRIPAPVDLQQRMLFPGGAGARGRGAAPVPAAPNPNAVTATITPASGPAVSGVLVEQSDFFVTVRQADGTLRVVRRAPGMKVVLTNPLQAHIDLLDAVSDDQIHDLVAYLVTMK